jgi:glycosyltransferase involved in cell wall biosynthesis
VKNLSKLKIAIVADWLVDRGGAEKVVEVFADIFPGAPIFTSFFLPENFPKIADRVRPSNFQKLPKFLLKKHRIFFPFYPRIFESFDFSKFDAVVSSSIFAAHGILTPSEIPHFCFCHSPARFLWDEKFLRDFPLPQFLKKMLRPTFRKLRLWDFAAGARPDFFWANSKFTAEKIRRFFGRNSEVLPPPVDFRFFSAGKKLPRGDFFLAAGRLVSQKNWENLIAAFLRSGKNLKIVGAGHLQKKLQRIASGAKNIEFCGFVDREKLREFFGTARATIFSHAEDAGIVPIESLAAGTPVVAFRAGGAAENLPKNCAHFFDGNSADEIFAAVQSFDEKKFSQKTCRAAAKNFSTEKFAAAIRNKIIEFQKTREKFSKKNSKKMEKEI